MASRSKLPENVVGFFRRVSAQLSENDPDEEVAERFWANTFEFAFKNNPLRLSRDKIVCCVLEKLLKLAPPQNVSAFLSKTLDCLDRYVSDKYASHVIQTALNQCLRANQDEFIQVHDEESPDSLNDLVVKISTGVTERLNDYVFDTYGSHVVCALIQVLSGVKVGDNVVRSRVSQKVAQKKTGASRDKTAVATLAETTCNELTEDMRSQLDSFCEAFTSMRDFSHCLTDQCGSKVLQTLLYCTHKRDEKRCKHLCRQVLASCKVLSIGDEDGGDGMTCSTGGASPITRLAEDAVASHGLECILKVASPKLIQRLCQQCFSGQLLSMALHPSANFVIQKLCDAIVTENQLVLLVDELLPYLEDVLAVCHFNVCTALVKAAARLRAKQEEVLEALMAAFHTGDGSKKCCRAFLALTTLDALDEQPKDEDSKAGTRPSLIILPQGCLLLAGLLGLSEPSAVLDSLLSFSTAELVTLATDKNGGSRVFEAFLACEGASSKRKRKLVKKLKGEFVQLACDKFGSYVVDACYKNTKSKSQEDIVTELLQEENKLRENLFGKHVIRNCDLHDYKQYALVMPDKHAQPANRKRMFSENEDYGEGVGEDDSTSEVVPPKKKSKKAKKT